MGFSGELMDKQTTIGFVLIALVLIIWMWLQTPPPAPPPPVVHDSVHVAAPLPRDTVVRRERAVASTGGAGEAGIERSRFFASRGTGTEKIIIVKTGLYTAELTTKGGLVRKWQLSKYRTWDGDPVQLVDFDRGGDFSLLFTTSDGKLVNTRNLFFETDRPAWQSVEISGSESVVIDLVLPVDGGGRIVKRFTFTGGSYAVGVDIVMENAGQVISNYEYQVVWESGLRYSEANSVDESSFAAAFASSGGEMTEIDAAKAGEPQKRELSGAVSWVASRSKYFAVALLAEEGKTQGAYLEGHATHFPNNGIQELYTLGLTMPFRGGSSETAHLQMFLGPLQYDIIKGLGRGLEKIMSLGAAWIIRPISEYIMIPLFEFLRGFIPNYGLVIIVFSIIIKIALHPLTRSSMRSMKKMQALTPMMNEIREKYKDNPEKMNQQVMNLYKEYGVNPASGCLPLLLQMPILFALYSVFRSSIELRQAAFVGWITDLSIPDTIVHLPFTVPLVGLNQLSGLALAMGATMLIQQILTPADPRNKTTGYIMSVMMTLLFTSLPSGLNLYYFVFNVLSIGQQLWINKQHGNEPLRKVEPKKGGGGIMGRITRDLPKLR
jgi:YidC/Oxa1 family membrane protein insertase